MFNTAVIDTAIGLVFLYLLLALVCTTLTELVESCLKKRAKQLEESLWGMLGGDSTTEGAWKKGIESAVADARKKAEETAAKESPNDNSAQKEAVEAAVKATRTAAESANPYRPREWLEKLYNHPLIFSLFSGCYKPGCRRLPSYIPTRSFALALLDLVKSTVPAKAGAEVTPTELLKAIEANQLQLPEKLQTALKSFIDTTKADLTHVRENIETWFDSTMDRVSGWYKRHAQIVTGVLALGLAVFLNADTFAVADRLIRDPALRAVLVTDATERVAKEQKNEAQKKDEPKKAGGDLTNQVNGIRGYGWPLGWDTNDDRTVPSAPLGKLAPQQSPAPAQWTLGEWVWDWRATGAWVLKAIGWFVTAVAVSLGAPFWFDTLNRIITIRSAMKPPPKDEAEKSK